MDFSFFRQDYIPFYEIKSKEDINMGTIQFTPNFVLAASNMELTKAQEAVQELNRLMSIGYMNSQTGLDVARDAKAHLVKAYELLAMVDIPEAKSMRSYIATTIGNQEIIIRRIELSL